MVWTFMVENVFSLIVCVASILLAVWFSLPRPSRIPPGPGLSWPIFGHAFSVGKDPRKKFREWRKKYGDIFSLYLGNRLVIVMNGYDVMFEAFVKNGDVFSERPHVFVFDELAKGKGVISNSGSVWKEQRRFAVSTLKSFGMGKSILESAVSRECSVFLQKIREGREDMYDFSPYISAAVANIICSIVIGKRFTHNDQYFEELMKRMEDINQSVGFTAVLNFIPVARYIPGDPFRFKRTQQNMDFFTDCLAQPAIEEHLKVFDEKNIPDLVAAYIKEIKMKENQCAETSIGFENLKQVIVDLTFAGTETTTTTIKWILLLLAKYPEIQRKCFQEIKENIGLEQAPQMSDQQKLPYTEATLTEVQRFVNVVPLSLWHSVPHDINFREYSFPKGVIILPNIDSVLHDPAVFEDPEEFRPERFLDPNGELEKHAEMIPFFLGKRICPGASLAKMELFLFVTHLIQNYQLQQPDGQPISLEAVPGMTFAPKTFKLSAVPRR